MKKTKINLVIKLLLLLLMVIVPLIVFLVLNIILKDYFNEYNSTNFILFSSIEIINIIIMLVVFTNNKITTKNFFVIIICYLIISGLIPIFHTERTYAPTGPGSELMGIAIEKCYRNIYGINITSLVDLVK